MPNFPKAVQLTAVVQHTQPIWAQQPIIVRHHLAQGTVQLGTVWVWSGMSGVWAHHTTTMFTGTGRPINVIGTWFWVCHNSIIHNGSTLPIRWKVKGSVQRPVMLGVPLWAWPRQFRHLGTKWPNWYNGVPHHHRLKLLVRSNCRNNWATVPPGTTCSITPSTGGHLSRSRSGQVQSPNNANNQGSPP